MGTNLVSEKELLGAVEKPVDGVDTTTPTTPTSNLPSEEQLLQGVGSPFEKSRQMSKNPSVDEGDWTKFGFQLKTGADNQELRAERQSAWDQLGNGLAKMVGTAGTTFATTFSSLPYGIGSAISSGRFADVYDNPISRKYDDFNKYMEQAFPNYYTHEEQDAPLYSPTYWFTSNFLADKILKNAGFTFGAIGAGSIISKALNGVGKIAMGEKIAQEMAKVSNLVNEGKTYAEALHSVGNGIRLADGISKIGAATIAAGSEAAIEALDGKNTMRAQLIEEYKLNNGGLEPQGYELQRIEDASDTAANVRFALNMPLLAAGDYIQFGRLFSGYKLERSVADRIAKEGGKYAVKEASFLNKLGKASENMLVEANEEGTQFAIQKGTQDYYNRQYHKESQGFINDLVHSTGKGLEAEFGTKEGLENILLGGITGLGFSFGTGEALAPFRADKSAQSIVDGLNQYIANPLFQNKYNTAIRSKSIADDRDKSVAEGDEYQARNLEFDNLKNLVNYAHKAGKFDIVSDRLDDYKKLDKEEFEKTFGLAQDGNNKSVSQYVDKVKSQARDLFNLKNDIDNRFGMFSEEVRDRMFDAAANGYNVDKREKQLQNEITEISRGRLAGIPMEHYPYVPGGDINVDFKKNRGTEVGTDAWKESVKEATKNWLSTEPNQNDVAAVYEKIRDLAQLRHRRHTFANMYRSLLDPEFGDQFVKAHNERVKAFQDDATAIYKSALEKDIENYKGDDEQLLAYLQNEQLNTDKYPGIKNYLDTKIAEVQARMSTTAAKADATANDAQAVVDTKAATPPEVKKSTPKKKKIETVEDLINSKYYNDIQDLILSGNPDNIETAIVRLQGIAESEAFPQEVRDFAHDQIDSLLKALPALETETPQQVTEDAQETPAQEISKVNKKKGKGREKKKEGKKKTRKARKPKVAKVVEQHRANIYLLGLLDSIELEEDGNQRITRNESIIKELMSGELGVGSQVRLRVDVKNEYGMPEGGHTMATLPIEVRINKGAIGFLNTLEGIEKHIEEVQAVLAVKKANSLKAKLAAPDLTPFQENIIRWRLGELTNSSAEVNKPLEQFLHELQESYNSTLVIREKIWGEYNTPRLQKDGSLLKDKTDFFATISYKNSGDIINDGIKNAFDMFGNDVNLWHPTISKYSEYDSDTLINTTTNQKFTRNPATSAYTNNDMRYSQGLVYVMVPGANSVVGDYDTYIPVPLDRNKVSEDIARELAVDIANLANMLKGGARLNNQIVTTAIEKIRKYIHVNRELTDKETYFKVHAHAIEIGYNDKDGKKVLTIYTQGYDESAGGFVDIEGLNFVLTSHALGLPEAGEVIASTSTPENRVQALDMVKTALVHTTRNVDYDKLADPEYKKFLKTTDALLTNVGELTDKSGNHVSFVSPGKGNVKVPLIISINDKITLSRGSKSKAKAVKEEVTPVEEVKPTEEVIPALKEEVKTEEEDKDYGGAFDSFDGAEAEKEATNEKEVDKVIETTLTPEEKVVVEEEMKAEQVAKTTTATTTTEYVKEKLKAPEKSLSSKIRAIIKKIRNAILALIIGSSVYVSANSITTNNDGRLSFDINKGVESVVDQTLDETKAQWAKRGLVKAGVLDIADASIRDTSVAPEVVESPKPEKFFEVIGTVPDKYHTQDSLMSYRSQWNNADGFNYIPAPNNGQANGKNIKIKGVIGVGHFLLDASLYGNENYSYPVNEQFLDLARKNNDYIPTFTRSTDGRVKLVYKRADAVSESDIVVSPLRQFAFTDVDFGNAGKAKGFLSSVKEIKKKDGSGTYLIFKDRDGYSRFSGGSVVFLWQDKYGNTIVRDFAGSINQIQKEGEAIVRDYSLKPGSLTLGYHDVGSYSAKPKAKAGEINTAQYSGYNPGSMTGGALLIPIEEVGNPAKSTEDKDYGGAFTSLNANKNTLGEVYSPYDIAKYGLTKEGGNASTVLDHILEHNLIPEYGIIINAFKDAIGKNDVKIRFSDEGDAPMSFNYVSNTIFINSKYNIPERYFQRFLVHEINHALLGREFTSTEAVRTAYDNGDMYQDFTPFNGSTFATEANRLYNLALNAIAEKLGVSPTDRAAIFAKDKNKYYGVSNVFEFLAEAGSNPEFRKVLESIPDTKKGGTVWEQFIRWVRRFIFGDYESVYSKAEDLIVDFLSTYQTPRVDKTNRIKKSNVLAPAFSHEIDHHYVNVLSGMTFNIMQAMPGVTTADIIADPTKDIKHKLYNALVSKRMKSLLANDNVHKQFLKIAESINDNVDGKWDLTKRRDDLGFWNKIVTYIDQRLGFNLDEEGFDLTQFKENKRDWDDTKESYISTKDNLSSAIKSLVATTPKLKSTKTTVKDGRRVYDADKATISGLAEFLDFYTVYPYIVRSMKGAVNVQDMLGRLERMTKHDPSFIRIKDVLESNPVLLSDWFRSFSLQSPAVKTILVDKGRAGVNVKIIDANRASNPVYNIADKWIDNIKVNLENKYYDKIRAEYGAEEKELKVALAANNIEKAISQTVKLANLLGIHLTQEVVESEVNSIDNQEKYGTQKEVLDTLFIEHINRIRASVFSGDFKEESRVNALADRASFYTYDLVESSYTDVQGNNVYDFTLPNFLSRIFDRLHSATKEGKEWSARWLKDIGREAAMEKYSNWIWKALKSSTYTVEDATVNSDFKKNFTYVKLDGIKRTDTRDGQNYTDFSETDWEVNKVLAYLESTKDANWIAVPILVPSDSGTMYFLQVPKIALRTGDVVKEDKDGRKVISTSPLSKTSAIRKAITNIAKQDIERFKAARELLFEIDENGTIRRDETGRLIEKNAEGLQEYYHFTKRDEKGKPILQVPVKNNKGEIVDYKPTGRVFQFLSVQYTSSRGVVKGIADLDEVSDALLTHGIFTTQIGEKISDFIDKFILAEVRNNYNLLTNDTIREAVAGKYDHIGDGTFLDFVVEYSLNQFIANAEQANFFYGSVAEYKSAATTNKYAKEVSTTSQRLSGIHTGEVYRATTLEDVILPSTSLTQMVEAIKNLVIAERGFRKNIKIDTKKILKDGVKASSLNEAERAILEIIKPYKNITTTDGQGYISIDRLRNVMKDQGKWDEKTHEVIYQKIKNGEEITSAEVRDITQPFQILKPFYFDREYDFFQNRMVSNQLKLALLPLIPSLTVGTQLDEIRKFMERENVDEVYYHSAEKIGNQGLGRIEDQGIIVSGAINHSPIREYYNDAWGVQVDVPQHMEDETNKLGTQISKLILTNISPKTTYVIGEDSIQGEAVIAQNMEVVSANIKESADRLIHRLGGTVSDKGNVSFPSKEKIREVLLDEIRKRRLSENYGIGLDLIKDEMGEENFTLPLFVNNLTNKYESILTALFTNNVTNQKFPGFHATLFSGTYFDSGKKKLSDAVESKANLDSVEYSKEFLDKIKAEDRSTKLTTRYENGVKVMEILVPTWSSKMYKAGERISINDLPKELREIILYRIPTQAKHSMAFCEVVGFLPSVSGSIAVLPDDSVAQMGGDFDLDTIFAMTPNIRRTAEGLQKVKYNSGTAKQDTVDRYNLLYGKRDELLQKYDPLNMNVDRASANLFDAIYDDIGLAYTEDEIRDILDYHEGHGSLNEEILNIVNSFPTLEEFSKLTVAEQNVRSARENRLFDLYKGILTNPAHVKEQITPAEFSDLERIQAEINEAYGEQPDKVNPLSNLGQNYFRKQAIQGRALKGMAAGANAFLAIGQVSRMHLAGDSGITIRYSIVDDGHSRVYDYKELVAKYGKENVTREGSFAVVTHRNLAYNANHTFTNVDDKVTTEYSSQSLGNAVDIVKKGFVPNVNAYTFYVWQIMPMIGISWDTASWLVNQPIVRELSDYYFEHKGLFAIQDNKEIDRIKTKWQTDLYKLLKKQKGYKTANKLRNAAEKDIAKGKNIYLKRENTAELLKYNPDDKLPLNLEELIDQVDTANGYNGLEDDAKIAYLTYQLKVIEVFNDLKGNGTLLRDAIEMYAPDRAGASPTMDVTNRFKELIGKYDDAEDTLNIGDSPAPKKVYSDDSVYSVLNSYYKYANQLSVKALSPFFIQQTKTFKDISGDIARINGIYGDDYLRNRIKNFTLSYLIKEFPFVSDANPSRLLGIGMEVNQDTNISLEEFQKLSTANKLGLVQDILKDHLAANPHHVLNFLTPELSQESVKTNKYQKVNFVSIGSNNGVLENIVIDSFRDIWNSADERVADLAKDLIAYNYHTNGFQYGFNSISKVIPTDLLVEIGLGRYLRVLNQGLDEVEEDEEIRNDTIAQIFAQNNWLNRDVVPVAMPEYEWQQDETTGKRFIKTDTEGFNVTKDNSPEWNVRKDGLVIVPKNRLKRAATKLRNSRYIRLVQSSYSAKTKETTYTSLLYKRAEEFEDADDKLVYYYPIGKLGAAGVLEFRQESIIPENNIEHDEQYYIDLIEDRLAKSVKEENENLGEYAAVEDKKNHSMSYVMPASENIWNEDTTTMAEVESGRRVATTRSYPLGKVGDIITFENKRQAYIIRAVEQLTEDKVKDPNWIEQWSQKEGWTTSHFKKVLGGKTVHVGSWQTTFERLDNQRDEDNIPDDSAGDPTKPNTDTPQKDIDDNYDKC